MVQGVENTLYLDIQNMDDLINIINLFCIFFYLNKYRVICFNEIQLKWDKIFVIVPS